MSKLIKCVKVLYDRVEELSLKEAKDIVEEMLEYSGIEAKGYEAKDLHASFLRGRYGGYRQGIADGFNLARNGGLEEK